MGANVIVTEVDEIKALEAVMDGFRVMPIKQAAKIADFICTLTGDINVVDGPHFEVMKNGCIISNSGHFDVELNLKKLKTMAKKVTKVRNFVEEYELKDGRKIYVLAQGRLINLASAEGHPAQVMDMSFSNQALAAEFLVQNKGKLENKVYTLPEKLDRSIARLKLNAIGVKYDKLTAEQKKYLSSWEEGT
jgi:adenosylhomocysteinase